MNKCDRHGWRAKTRTGCPYCEVDPSESSASPDGYKDVLDAIEKAEQHVIALCTGKEKWTMRVPVDEERDSDCLIMRALTKARETIESW